jgi:hypothetical protein
MLPGRPTIGAVDSTPTGPSVTPAYLTRFANPPLPPNFKLPFVKNPNLALEDAILGQTITSTVALTISTTPIGDIVNIRFIDQNAKPTQFDAIFWIETVQQPVGSGTFMQLQYTQTVVLKFFGIDWPHLGSYAGQAVKSGTRCAVSTQITHCGY